MSNLCAVCLSGSRSLHLIEKINSNHIYKLILIEINVYDLSQICLRFCSECKAMLESFEKFKDQVKSSFAWLMKQQQNLKINAKDITVKPQISKIKTTNTLLDAIKTEHDTTCQNVIEAYLDIKEEVQEDEHCEPETFVKDLGSISPTKDAGVKVNKTKKSDKKSIVKKSKFKKKLKVAKKRKRKVSSSDGVSISHVSVGGNTHSGASDCERETAVESIVGNRDVDSCVKAGTDASQVEVLKNAKAATVKSQLSEIRSTIDTADAIKTEYDKISQNVREAYLDIKEEVQEDEHCEPETFVKDLGSISPTTEAGVKVNKTKKSDKKSIVKKSKFKKKLKVAKKRKRKVSSSDGVSIGHVSVGGNTHSGASDCERETAVESIVGNRDGDSCVKAGTDASQVEVLKVDNVKNGTIGKVVRSSTTREQLAEKPQCVECGKMFSSKKTYRYHLNVLHKGQNRYPCPRCGKVYQWKSNLGRHMRTHKARDSGELYCEACNKRFASVATYRQHLRVSRRHVSETEFSFMCNECGKKFLNKTRLRDHIDWEHLNKIKFRCQLCNKPFKCHTSLYVHMQNVHRSKEKKDNLCHVCGKSYQNAAKLKYHIVAMHTSETPYRCDHCAAAFGWYSSLYRHVREVHYKMKVQPKKSKKLKMASGEPLPHILPQ